jgi:magnesium transporter
MEQVVTSLDQPDTITWVRVTGLHDLDVIARLGLHINVHPLVQEDIVNTRQRTKAETYEDYVFVVFRHYHESGTRNTIAGEQVSIILSMNCVISFHESEHPAFDVIYERIQHPAGRFRRFGADYLAYALIDIAVDQAMIIYEDHFDELEQIENRLFLRSDRSDYRRIHRIRRNLVNMKKSVSPLRDVFGILQRSDTAIVSQGVRVYFNDVHDHVTRITENAEDALFITESLLNTYIAESGLRMNDIIRVLTIMSTIFIPLTFLVGVYGMNFEHMPELAWQWGYPAAWGIMILLVIGMLFIFRKMRWL